MATIREFTSEDLEAVAKLWQAVFAYAEPRNHPARVIAQKLAWERRRSAQREVRLLVAEEGGSLAGTVMVGYDGHRGWLYRLAVVEALRRRGIGRELVRAAEAKLSALGCTKVNLQLHAHNDSAARFWEALGYAIEPRISMGKDLTGAAPRG